MAGNTFGDAGYAGIASYLLTGAKDISTKHNQFFVYTGYGSTDKVDRETVPTHYSQSEMGAPSGPFTVCISKYDSSSSDKCGAERTFKSGDFKFSIFGHLFNEDDTTNPKREAINWGNKDHLGFRMKVRRFLLDVIVYCCC